MSEELKPCPFCGKDKVSLVETEDFENANKGLSSWHVSCRNKDCHGSIFSLYIWQFRSETQAVKAWNTRAKPTFTKEDVEKAKNALLECSQDYDNLICFEYPNQHGYDIDAAVKKCLNAVGRVEE